jgi:hypothetical protein
VAPAQPKDDASNLLSRARTSVMQLESWTPGPCVARTESWAPRGSWQAGVMAAVTAH